jgi:predicted flap endonuclease-1-like 5' DNA nuclease
MTDDTFLQDIRNVQDDLKDVSGAGPQKFDRRVCSVDHHAGRSRSELMTDDTFLQDIRNVQDDLKDVSGAGPQKFDRLTNGVLTFEVQPVNDRCFYVTNGMIHIHAKQVHA